MEKKYSKVGAMLRRLRKEQGWTLAQVGQLIGYSEKTVCKAENSDKQPSITYIKSFIDGMALKRQEALELMSAAGIDSVHGTQSKAPVYVAQEPEPEPVENQEKDMSYQEAVCFYALQATMSKKLDDFTAQMILKILGAL